MTQTKTLNPENTTERTTIHRCDSCGATAEYLASKKDKTLSFCGHHIRAFEATLLSSKFVINPDTYRI